MTIAAVRRLFWIGAGFLACGGVRVPASQGQLSGPPFPDTQLTPCIVSRITDGDSFECEQQGRVRLIGIDAPERSQAPFGEASANALDSMMPLGTAILMQVGIEARDQYDRLLADVWLDSTLINWRMAREGWAITLTYPPNVRYVDWLAAAVDSARIDNVGLWATDGFDCLPVDRRRRLCD